MSILNNKSFEIMDSEESKAHKQLSLFCGWYDAEGNEQTVEFHYDMNWAICPVCEGEGKHSLHIGAITEDDRARDWSEDEFADYMDGGYDKACDDCHGTGKLLQVEYPSDSDKSDKAAVLRMYLQDREESERERAHEIRMGY